MASVTGLVQAASRGCLADVQRLLGHEKEPQPEQEPPVNVDAAGADGLTALMRATAGGHLDIVQLLLDHGAIINKIATRSYVTPLMLAASEGHVSTVKLLCERGATIDAQMNTGDTPLMLAATYGHASIVEYLLDKGADIEMTTDNGWTALMFAAFEGHAGALRVLKRNDANIERKNTAGRTATMLAITKGHADVIRELLKENNVMNNSVEWMQKGSRLLHIKEVEAHRQYKIKKLEARINVDSIGELTQRMHESQKMTKRLHVRLVAVDKVLKDRPESNGKNIALKFFKEILLHTYSFLRKYSRKLTVTRLVSSLLVIKACRDAHEKLDDFIDKRLTSADAVVHEGWKDQFEIDTKEQQAAFDDPELQNRLLNDELKDEQAQTEALTLLLFATTNKEESVSQPTDKMALARMNKIYQKVASLSSLEVDNLPNWFVPPQEVDINVLVPFAKGSFGYVAKGVWKGNVVAIKSTTVKDDKTRDLFKREVDIWHKLQAPHIARLYGACHVGDPFFVCEYASNGTLSKYLLKVDSIVKTWGKLYETSLGLWYLHETAGLVHGDLKCNNILVGDDSKAKITDFGRSFILGSDDPPPHENDEDIDAIAWKAPEILQHKTRGTFETDVYAFGMCIIEAVTGRSPWGIVPDTTIKEKLLREHTLPKQPKNMNDQQWDLVKLMCAFDPAKRPNVKTVVDKLKELKGDAYKELSKAAQQQREENERLQEEQVDASIRSEKRNAEAANSVAR